MFNLPTGNIGGQELFVLEFGDIVNYFSPYTAALFVFALIFTVLAIVSRPERQVDIAFGGDAYGAKEVSIDLMRFQRFMAIACGLATLGAMVSGDVFNFTLFASLVGITNIGIVAAYRNRHVLNAAFQYGIVAMLATVPLFGAAIILASTGTLSMWGSSLTGLRSRSSRRRSWSSVSWVRAWHRSTWRKLRSREPRERPSS